MINYTLGELRINEWKASFDRLLSRRTKEKGIWRRKGALYFLSWGVRLLIIRFLFFFVIDTLQKIGFRPETRRTAHVEIFEWFLGSLLRRLLLHT